MNTLNHSISPNGQPLPRARASGTQDACQHLSVAPSSQAAHALKLIFQSNSSKKSSLAMASRDSLQVLKPISTISDVEFEPVAQSFLCSLTENEQFIRIDNAMGKLNGYTHPKPSFALSVSVSSAVKLDCGQIELIARKMQKLTGFRNLRLDNVVDSSLIAGFTISYGDEESNVIDLSVKGQLAALAARVESSEQRIADNVLGWSSSSA